MSKTSHCNSVTGAALLLGFLASVPLAMSAAPQPPAAKHTPQAVVDGSAKLVNHFDGNQMMRLVIALQPPHPEEEKQFLHDVHTKGTPIFHKFLAPDQWVTRFSPTAQDEQMVLEWAQSNGLHVTQRYPNRALVAVEAPAATVEKALQISINNYQLRGATFFSNDRDPQIPSHLNSVVQTVLGLNSRAMLHPHIKGRQTPSSMPAYVAGPEVAAGASLVHDAVAKRIPASLERSHATGPTPDMTNNRYDPTDIYGSNAYDYNALQNQGHCCNPLGNAGSSPPEASIGIATAYAADFNDLNGFFAQYPYLAYNIQAYYIGGTPVCPSNNPTCNEETTLDTEWATATANSFGAGANTAKVFVYEGVDNSFATFTKIYNQMIADNSVRVVTTSWGCAESACYDTGDMDAANNLFAQMTGQGWTVVASSDDNGATAESGSNPATCTTYDSVDFPASSPNVIAAGGTTLELYSDSTYASEVAWTGDTFSGACAGNNGGSGGGFSSYYSAPSYQSPNGFAQRAVPDIALNANVGQNYYYQGSLQGVGGTSIVAPELAGFFAQENAYLLSLGNICGSGSSACAPMGNANYYIYNEGNNSSYAQHYPFYDITSGCNSNDVTAAYGLNSYCASTGYDEVTGWGSANMLQLAWSINTYLAFDGGRPVATFSGPGTGVWFNTDRNVSWSVADTTGGGYPANGVAGFSQGWDVDPGDVFSEATPGSGNSFYSGPQFPNATGGYLALSWAGQGCHTAYVRSWDNTGLSGLQTYGSVCYDTIAPSSYSLLSPAANGYGWDKSNVYVYLNASDAGSGSGTGSGVYATYYSVDNANCSSSNLGACTYYSAQFNIGTQGRHTVRYFTEDKAGNFQSVQAAYVNIDETAPVTAASLGGTLNGSVYVSAVAVTLNRSDALSGVSSTTYQVDGGGVQTYASPFSVSSLGTHTITYHSVDYAGNVESSKTTTFTIHSLTTTTVASSLNPSSTGASVTFTATVTGTGTPTGNVTFLDGSSTLGTVALSGGRATYSTSRLAAGSHAIKANYTGASNFIASAGTLTQNVDRTSTTTLASSSNPSHLGQGVIFTASVSSSSGTPGGSVTFKSGSMTLGSGTLSGGKATLSIANLSVGAHAIEAYYSGGSGYLASTSSALTQTVDKGTSTTAVTGSSTTSTFGSSVTFTATVSPSSPSATGTVTFKDGSTTLGVRAVSGGKAVDTITGLAVGTHSITAAYSGDANYLTSTSSALSHTVDATTSTTVASSLNPTHLGQGVTFTATVSSSSGTPSGTVTFKNGTATLGSGSLAGGKATLYVTNLAVGTHSIQVVYAGTTLYLTSTSSVLTQTVNKIGTSTALAASSGTAKFGTSVTFTAKITPSSAGYATGTVTFKDGSATLGTRAVSSGTSVLTTTSLAKGSHSITAVYSGDGNYLTSTSPAVPHTVD